MPSSSDAPIARTRRGDLRGRRKEGVCLFAGIPYAAAPVGSRRFAAPEPIERWSGVRPAERFGAAAPQRVRGGGLTDAPPARMDEDCLFLNVCTPAVDDARRPVLVWIHGGGFRTGQGGIPWYNGASFANRGDVVVVSINYRLGVLGFANLGGLAEELAETGAAGLLDQIAALEWVRENIEAFGGDPRRVTIAGESAGGMSVGSLLGSPRARGLFRGAIAQSGAAHHVLSPEVGRAVGRRFAELLGARDLAELHDAPVESILAAQEKLEDEIAGAPAVGGVELPGGLSMPFQPSAGTEALPEPPLDAVRKGNAGGVSVMAGTNADETTLFHAEDVSPERLRRIAEKLLGDDGERALSVYGAARPDATPRDLLVALTSDEIFRIPAVRLCEAHAANGDRAFQYLFSWRSRAFGGRLGATHALEIPFAFNNLDRPGVDVFLGDVERPQALADAMHDAWIAFVREGHPGHAGLPEWPAFEPDRRSVMEFGERVDVVHDPAPEERALWDGRR